MNFGIKQDQEEFYVKIRVVVNLGVPLHTYIEQPKVFSVYGLEDWRT
jgi:hypothetical protein